MMEENNIVQHEKSLLEIIGFLIVGRKVIFISTSVFFVFAIVQIFYSNNEYVSKSRLLSENGGVATSNISSLANLAGISLPNKTTNSNDLDPAIYSSVLESTPFLLSILNEKVVTERGEKVLFKDYLNSLKSGNIWLEMGNAVLGLPDSILSLFESSNDIKVGMKLNKSQVRYLKLTSSENRATAVFRKRVKVDIKDRFVDFSVTLPDPKLSAEINLLVTDKLVNYVIKYKTAKRVRDLDFLEERTSEARKNFLKAQSSLLNNQDNSLGLIFESGHARQDQLKAQYDLYFNIYNNLLNQLEQSKIQLKESTPVFTDFEPVILPSSPTNSSSLLIIFLHTIFGFILGVIILITKKIARYILVSI
jgi:uncharacterized protein involved in exopolysaccharide biosynthesis